MKSINDLYETTPSHKQDIQFLQEVAECLSQRIRRIPLLIQALGENQVVSKKTIDEKLRAVEPSIEELSKSIMSALEAAKD